METVLETIEKFFENPYMLIYCGATLTALLTIFFIASAYRKKEKRKFITETKAALMEVVKQTKERVLSEEKILTREQLNEVLENFEDSFLAAQEKAAKKDYHEFALEIALKMAEFSDALEWAVVARRFA